MIIFGSSSTGNVRKDNQDSYVFDIIQEHCGYAVVCDGMGGPGGGKIASGAAVGSFARTVSQCNENFDAEQIKSMYSEAINSANREILDKAAKDKALIGMGTTLVGVTVCKDRAYFVNIGDSRAYLLRNDGIKRVSHDHSAVQRLVDSGILTESQARNHPNKNIITRALGVEDNIDFDFFEEQALENDMLILCSDGITNYIDDMEISFEALKCKGNIEKIPQSLIELANSRGGADNSTVVVMKI